MNDTIRQTAWVPAILLVLASAAAAADAQGLLDDFDIPPPNRDAFPLDDADVSWFHTYVNLWWIALMIAAAVPPLYVAAWINHDSARVGLDPFRWNIVFTVILAAGAVLYVVAPPYVSAPALLIATWVLMQQYIPARNAQVIPERRLFTPQHRAILKREFLTKFGVHPKGQAERLAEVAKVQTPVELHHQSGQVISPAEAKLDENDPMTRVKAFFAEVVDRRAREAYLVPESGHFETSFKVDGVVHAGPRTDPTVARAVMSTVRQMVAPDSDDPHFAVVLPTLRKRMIFHAAFSGEGAAEWLCLRPREEGEKPLKLEELGLTQKQEQTIRGPLDRGQGLLAVASSPGMGARTTVYAMLGSLDPFSRNIVTFEDPVFGHLTSIEQNDLSRPDASLDEMLAGKLRGDYDVMMFSGPSTNASARAALTAAQREQFVIARFEAAEGRAVTPHLLKLGVDAAAIADGLKCVVAQRVLRRLCENCRVQVAPPAELLQRAGVAPSKVEHLWEENPTGCETCAYTGFNGRIGIFSVWMLGEEGRRLIRETAHVRQIRETMRKEGALGLQRAGLMRVLEGKTSLKEVARVLK